MSRLFDGLVLSREQQLLDGDSPFHGAYEDPSAAAFTMVSEECRHHGKNHAVGKQDQNPAFRR